MKLPLVIAITFIRCVCLAQSHTLSFFIDQAKHNSPLLNQYRNQILSNRLDSQILRASLKTQVNFLSNSYYAPIIHGYGYDEDITNIATVQGLMQATKQIVGINNRAAQYETFRLQNQALTDTIKLSEKDIVRTITEQYLTAYGDMLTMDFNKEIYDLLNKEEILLKKLTRESVYKQSDYLTFYVTYQQQELTWLQSQVQYNADVLILNYLAGIVDTTIMRLEQPSLADTAAINFFESVFYTRFATDSLRIVNEKTLVNFSYKPKLSIYTDAGYNSSTQHMLYKNFGFSAGLNLSIPIYDAHQKRLKYSKLDIEERSRLASREFFLNQYNQQMAQLKLQLRAINQLESKINQQITYAYTLIGADNRLLETGDIRIADYVTAINTYLNAKNLLTQNLINRLRLANQINYWNR